VEVLRFLVSRGCLDAVISALKGKGIDDSDIIVLKLEPRSDQPVQGIGRKITMESPLLLSEVVNRAKKHLGVGHLRVATARGADLSE
jgi:hypothetical protein